MANIGRKPDFTVSVFVKDAQPHINGKCGVAWTRDDGSIQVKLDPATALFGAAHYGWSQVLITLFPSADGNSRASGDRIPKEAESNSKEDNDVPF